MKNIKWVLCVFASVLHCAAVWAGDKRSDLCFVTADFTDGTYGVFGGELGEYQKDPSNFISFFTEDDFKLWLTPTARLVLSEFYFSKIDGIIVEKFASPETPLFNNFLPGDLADTDGLRTVLEWNDKHKQNIWLGMVVRIFLSACLSESLDSLLFSSDEIAVVEETMIVPQLSDFLILGRNLLLLEADQLLWLDERCAQAALCCDTIFEKVCDVDAAKKIDIRARLALLWKQVCTYAESNEVKTSLARFDDLLSLLPDSTTVKKKRSSTETSEEAGYCSSESADSDDAPAAYPKDLRILDTVVGTGPLSETLKSIILATIERYRHHKEHEVFGLKAFLKRHS